MAVEGKLEHLQKADLSQNKIKILPKIVSDILLSYGHVFFGCTNRAFWQKSYHRYIY